jgi:pre-rRNA-processing protein TSR3
MSKARRFKDKHVKYEDKPHKQLEEEFPVRLSMWYFDQCDPKRCSGMILKKHGYLSTLSKSAKFNGIVLTPTATKIISPDDHELVGKLGLCVIDCSWQYFDEVKVKSVKANERLLPYCLASNPVNYGKEIKVNCAEAFAGALYLSGFQEEAERIMDVFKWGPAFFSVNEMYFDRYLQCKNSEEMDIA